MKLKFSKAIILLLIFSLIAIQAEALDYPHTTINEIGCNSCHFVYGDGPSLLKDVEGIRMGIDDTLNNIKNSQY